MRITIIILLILTGHLFASGQVPEFEWAGQCGNPSNTTDARTSLATGEEGCFYMAGEFLDTVKFGEKSFISAGGTDIYLVKYTPEGIVDWSVRLGGTDYDFIHEIVTDADGNVVMTGYFYGTIQIGSDSYTSFGSQDLFIAKYDPSGNFLWSQRAGGLMADYVKGLTADDEGNTVMAGHFYNTISFGDTTVVAGSSSDIFLAEYTSDGQLGWVATAGGSSSDQVSDVTACADGKFLVAASFYYDITFGDTTMSTADPVGVAIARFGANGQFERAFQLDGTYLGTENYIEACHSGGFFLAGNFSSTVFFGDKTFEAGEFNQDIFTARYTEDMQLQWARHGHSIASDQVVGLETDVFDNIYLTGHYLDSIYFDTLKLRYLLCCGSREIFIVKYNANGSVAWGEQITGTRANIQSMTLDDEGGMILSGMFTEEVTFGPFVLSNFDHFRNYISCLNTGLIAGVFTDKIKRDIALFPNPAYDHIGLRNVYLLKTADYQIFNMNGVLLMEGLIGDGQRINVSLLKPGQYIFRLIKPDGTIESFFFTKY